jgi:eukaryotic translation initiation factor 2C
MPLQGTGRSAHYFVLTNQMRLSSDDLQRITHATCYIYARATKGVSYCAPAYYADRLCDRGHAWLREHLLGTRSVPQGEDEDFEVFKQRALGLIDSYPSYWRPLDPATHPPKYGAVRRNPWHPNLDDIMFYL